MPQKRILLTLVAIFAFGSGFARAEAVVDVENKAYYLCKNRKEVRTIRVQINPSGICNTLYSKAGEEKLVGSGRNHNSCIDFLNNIRTNLEKSNWNCRDISSARITASAAAE